MAAEKDIDRIVQAAFFPSGGNAQHVMIEVGAAGPDYLSIGAHFRRLGWQVLSVEPNPQFCEQHRALGNDVAQFACSDEDRDGVDFFVVDSNQASYLGGNVSFESFSSLGIKDGFADDLRKSSAKPGVSTIQVDVRKLDTILAEHTPPITRVDLLAVDVEGWELSVMRGFSLQRFQPKVVILENLFRSAEYRRTMRQEGYRRWKRLKPNEIYVRTVPLWTRLRNLFRRTTSGAGPLST